MNRIKLALLESKKPQYEIARLAGIHETRISRLATGRCAPTPVELKALASALGIPERDLMQRQVRR